MLDTVSHKLVELSTNYSRHCALDVQSHRLGASTLDLATPYRVIYPVRGDDNAPHHCEALYLLRTVFARN